MKTCKRLTEKNEGQQLYADSPYAGEYNKTVYKKGKVINKIIEKGYRNKLLTKEQKANNKEKSRTRGRIEHLFGFAENRTDGSIIYTTGIVRAKAKIGLWILHKISVSVLNKKNSFCYGIGISKNKRDTFVSILYLVKYKLEKMG